MDLSTPLYGIFRKNVERLMGENAIGTSELAGKMDVTPSYVSQIMSGHRNVGLEALDKFARALGVSPDSLLRANGRKTAKSA